MQHKASSGSPVMQEVVELSSDQVQAGGDEIEWMSMPQLKDRGKSGRPVWHPHGEQMLHKRGPNRFIFAYGVSHS